MNILITDDHILMRDGLRLLLRPLADDLNILEASSLDQALAIVSEQEKLDLVLLELGAPGVDGVAGVRTLRATLSGVPIVVLGASRGRDEIIAALESGANGYVPRSANGRLLLSALQLVLSGETYVPSVLLSERGAPGEGRSIASGALRGPLGRLTARQRDVLGHLARGRSNADIAEAMGIEVNTAKNHVKAILKTLDASNRTEAVIEAVRLGFKPPGGDG